MKRKPNMIDEIIGRIKASVLLLAEFALMLVEFALSAFAIGSSIILLFKFFNWLFLL